jgi:hypothetical protein
MSSFSSFIAKEMTWDTFVTCLEYKKIDVVSQFIHAYMKSRTIDTTDVSISIVDVASAPKDENNKILSISKSWDSVRPITTVQGFTMEYAFMRTCEGPSIFDKLLDGVVSNLVFYEKKVSSKM